MTSARSQPCGETGTHIPSCPQTSRDDPDPWCGYCGRDCNPYDFNDAAGDFVCSRCLSEMVEAHHKDHR